MRGKQEELMRYDSRKILGLSLLALVAIGLLFHSAPAQQAGRGPQTIYEALNLLGQEPITVAEVRSLEQPQNQVIRVPRSSAVLSGQNPAASLSAIVQRQLMDQLVRYGKNVRLSSTGPAATIQELIRKETRNKDFMSPRFVITTEWSIYDEKVGKSGFQGLIPGLLLATSGVLARQDPRLRQIFILGGIGTATTQRRKETRTVISVLNLQIVDVTGQLLYTTEAATKMEKMEFYTLAVGGYTRSEISQTSAGALARALVDRLFTAERIFPK
ncbi:MAG: hypothetical protein A3K06_01175 [Candidatus Doudnabacteria bacterium RIFCSPHIGHO2_01_52_17]|uniref:Uncharacterized protein n=1 Tax=Candidatus Doudnabacteria bacterium RIFCSPHIGHO2_01_52_17 TaxID=1817820 RepID=A0A1F5NA21_9BACT|nr:MAG: hypothetical protein A3K06_01175 [Candidatus Doudnabacteria bacterium RIFCSPHIGHO2_01_52_17]